MKRYAYCFALLALFATVAGSGCSKEHYFPEGLVGTWQATPGSNYDGASFVVTKSHITFRRDNGFEDVNEIREIKSQGVQPGRETIALRYRHPSGGEQVVTMTMMHEAGKSVIRFRYKPDIDWVRVKP